MRRGAEHVGAAQRIAGAIDAGAFAVPQTEYALEPLAGEGVDLLGAPQHGGRQVLVQPRLKADVMRGQQLLAAPQFLIQAAERGATIAGDQAGRVVPGRSVQPRLFQHQPHHRLHAGQQDRCVEIDEAAFQGGGSAVREFDIHRQRPSGRAARPARNRSIDGMRQRSMAMGWRGVALNCNEAPRCCAAHCPIWSFRPIVAE